MDEDKIIEQFVKNLSIGIPGPESNGNYSAQNKEGSAAGKYQFTGFWLDKAGKDSIQSFAKNSKIFEVPKTMDDFKNDPILQDAYFRHYAKNVLYPQAKKAYKGPNPANLSLEAMGALFHFKPPVDDKYGNTGAYKQIRTGVFDKETKKGIDGAKYSNASSVKYINKVNKAITDSGNKLISKNDLVKSGVEEKKNSEQIVNEFKESESYIDNSDLTREEKEVKRKELYDKVKASGNAEIINEHIESENAKNKERHNAQLNLVNIFKDADVTRSIIKDKNAPGGKKVVYDQIKTEWTNQDLDAIKEQFPEIAKYLHVRKDGDQSRFVVNKDSKFLDYKTNTIPEFVDAFKKLNKDFLVGGEATLKDEPYSRVPGSALFEDITELFSSSVKKPGTFGYNVQNNEYKERVKINTKGYVPQEVKETKPKSSKPEDSKKNESGGIVEETKKSTVEPINDETDLAEHYFQTALSLNPSGSNDFNYEPGKKEIPIDAIMGVALGLIGNEQAKNAKIPLRTEQVSEAIKNYTAELSQKAKTGLPVEIEAAIKNQLADAYQGGLANIVNASAGNRATVLGNLGSLEASKNKGLVAIQVADYEAKDRAFAQYGDAIKYINDFNARRDIANHDIKYREAKEKQYQGRDLAAAGFNKLVEALRYDKENGPGSVNDQYRSLLMQKMFGFDPKMPDDGTGEKQGTKSYYDKNKAFAKQDFTDTQELYKKFGSLNPEQKTAFNKLIGQTQDKKAMNSFIDYVKGNPDQDMSKLSMDNLDIALERNDFSVLAKNRNVILDNNQSVSNVKPSGLTDMSNLLSSPEIPSLATPGINANIQNGLASTFIDPEDQITINNTMNDYYNNQ